MSVLRPIPAEPQSVTPEWLSEALSFRFPETRVESVEVCVREQVATLTEQDKNASNAKLGMV